MIAFENRSRCKDGCSRWLLWNAVPVPAEGLIYASARDFTERKEMDQRLNQQLGRRIPASMPSMSRSPPVWICASRWRWFSRKCARTSISTPRRCFAGQTHTHAEVGRRSGGFRVSLRSGPHPRVGQGHAGRAALGATNGHRPRFRTRGGRPQVPGGHRTVHGLRGGALGSARTGARGPGGISSSPLAQEPECRLSAHPGRPGCRRH